MGFMTMLEIKDFVEWRKEAEVEWERHLNRPHIKERLENMHGPIVTIVLSFAREAFIKGYLRGSGKERAAHVCTCSHGE